MCVVASPFFFAQALAPKKFSTGAWRPGPRSIRFRYHHDPRDAGVGPALSPDLLRDPLAGNFTVDADRDVVGLVSRRIALRYATYAASGSTAWDATIDVHRRPAWLKRLAGVAPDQRELPRGVSKLATRAGVHDTVLAAYRSASRVVESFRARTTFSSDGDGAPGTFPDDLDGVLLEEPEEEEEATSPSLFVKD